MRTTFATVKDAADHIAAATAPMDPPKKRKNRVPVRIRLDGKFVKLASGKSIWNCEGHAKVALQGHVNGFVYFANIEEITDEERRRDDVRTARVVYEYLVESGRAEFVPYEDDDSLAPLAPIFERFKARNGKDWRERLPLWRDMLTEDENCILDYLLSKES